MILESIWNRIYDDFLMPSGLASYRRLLESALRAGFDTVSIERFWQLIVAGNVDPARRYLILRHDIDTDSRTAAEMWEIERSLGIAGSYYFRLSTLDLGLMKRIASGGGEVSYHYEELAAVAKEHRLHDRESVLRRMPEIQDRFRRNLETLREATGLSMRVVASHGDFVNRRVRLPNYVLLIDPRMRRLADIDLEVYDDAFLRNVSHKHSDTGHPWHESASDIGSMLDARVPVLYVLVHPRNWQARRPENAIDDLRRLKEGVMFRVPTMSRSSPSHPSESRLGSPSPELEVSRSAVSSTVVQSDGDGAPARRSSVEAPSSPAAPALVLVHAPGSYESERRYILDVVLGDWLGVDYQLVPSDKPGFSLSLQGDAGGSVLELPDVLFATAEADWLSERSMPSLPLVRCSVARQWIDVSDRTGARVADSPPIPVLFAEPGAPNELFRKTSTGIAFGADIFGSAFYLLSRYEEVARPYRDEHDRYPSYASLAAIEGFLERPLVDEYVDALWVAMHDLWPVLTRRRSGFRLRLTHDVDQPWAALGYPASKVLRTLSGDLILRHDPVLAVRRAASLVAARAGKLNADPYNTFDLLMDTSERHGLASTFYFMAGNTAGAIDGRYRLSDPPLRRLLKRIHDRGHEVGLHASYGTYLSQELIQREATVLKAACVEAGFDQPTWGVRHHYLRLRVPTTWEYHELAGLDHDSSLGFADHVGFRAGTCREYGLYDLLARRSLRLRQRPLVAMDATLFGYQSLDHDRALSKTRSLVDTCRRHGGDAVLLYHNGVVGGTRFRAQYPAIIEALVHQT